MAEQGPENWLEHSGHKVFLYIRWVIVFIILCSLVLGIAGFLAKWAVYVLKPQAFLGHFPSVAEDIFWLLLVYEIVDLVRTLSPDRLMDVLLTVLARKILLSADEQNLALEVGAFTVVLLVRLAWFAVARGALDGRFKKS
ncbi:MAG: hypothetical protein OWQ59_04475 [Alicyclobacillaceae bacterium]|jgi:uncharacterized membrane protein (DUF373 family)|uniref:hypothetical protein n=1 Tax=Alicyclobacillus sp. SP_1 TaxID=2942475 RepID=UPI00215732B9|nr:hypothetical protein [Alicyclobacillus sp. SP_1]MCY0887695.1 hypothetical protein [Alicyclobacillaceae bacterium]